MIIQFYAVHNILQLTVRDKKSESYSMAISIQKYIEICQCNASTKYRSVAADKQIVYLFSLSRESPKGIL
jgi:hypothetical protein